MCTFSGTLEGGGTPNHIINNEILYIVISSLSCYEFFKKDICLINQILDFLAESNLLTTQINLYTYLSKIIASSMYVVAILYNNTKENMTV